MFWDQYTGREMMKPGDVREWTFNLYNRVLPSVPDAYELFRQRLITDCPSSDYRMVDLGCGHEDFLFPLRDRADEIVGVDIIEVSGRYHRYIEANLNKEIPLDDNSVDVVICRYVLEHLEFPRRLFEEAYRILRPGGVVILLTPNVLYYPYTANHILSQLMKQKRRMNVVQRITGRESDDIFPVLYRCNTPRKVKNELEGTGFEILLLATYCDCLISAFNRPLGLAAIAYEYIVNAFRIDGAKGLIVAEGRKSRSDDRS